MKGVYTMKVTISKSSAKGTTVTPTMKMVRYLSRVGVALSILINVVTGGQLNQTFSARNWGRKKRKQLHLVWFIDFFLGKGHCLECWVWWKCRGEWK